MLEEEIVMNYTKQDENNNDKIAKDNNLLKLMKEEYSYPSTTDVDFLSKIYRKREFYYHKIPNRPKLDNYDVIKEFRENICVGKTGLLEQQAFLSNFINPDTPYRGVLVFHG